MPRAIESIITGGDVSSSSDLITLEYTPDLTQAGIAYLTRALACAPNPPDGSDFDALRRSVADKAVQLAYRRYLEAEKIPYRLVNPAPLTEPERLDVALGERRNQVFTTLLADRATISRLSGEPDHLMAASALVPSGQVEMPQNIDDLCIFAFLTGLVTPNREELKKALAAGQPVSLIHALPGNWSRPAQWTSLGTLALEADCTQPVTLSVCGQDAGRAFLEEEITLHPSQRAETRADFYSLAYLQVNAPPDGMVEVYSPTLNDTYRIAPHQWGNLWVYGIKIILAGYLPWGDFRKRAKRIPQGRPVWGAPRLHAESLALPITELRPMGDLFKRASEWAKKLKRG